MRYQNKVFAFVFVLVIIFCTSCASNEETSTTSTTTALEKNTYVCREIAHPKNNKASDLGWGESMVNSPGSFTIMTGAFPAAGVSHCTKYEYIILRNGVWIDLEPVRERVLHIIEQYTDKEIKSDFRSTHFRQGLFI